METLKPGISPVNPSSGLAGTVDRAREKKRTHRRDGKRAMTPGDGVNLKDERAISFGHGNFFTRSFPEVLVPGNAGDTDEAGIPAS